MTAGWRPWRIVRWPMVVILLPTVALIQLAIFLVVAMPFDRTALIAESEPLVILDVHGDEIATLPAAGADRTRWTSLPELPAIAVSAVVESEDAGFWDHRGVDATGFARALWLDLRGGHFGYGGSTLTMQVARMLLGNDKRSLGAKVHETLMALRIERAVDKRTILEQWMNRAYFANGAYGFDAAARLYFGKPASQLSVGEATLVAVIPRAPTAYDPLIHLDVALQRRDHVLDLLVERGVIDERQAADARAEHVVASRHAPIDRAPHFTRFVLDLLPQDVRRVGGTIHTTLDLRLQATLDHRVAEQLAQLRGKGLTQAGIVVLDTETGAVKAMVGSTDDSQINVTTRRRHPGSALKPFVYATAIEKGGSPSSIAWDIRDLKDDLVNSGVEHGPVRYREALASSYNFAAISVLDEVGVPRVMSALRTAGVADLKGTPNDYGLRLALGSAKVRLVDMTAGYGFVVKQGLVGSPRPITNVVMPDGSRWQPKRAPDRRLFTAETSWLVMNMLSDPEARRPGFGMELPFDLPFKIAAKTGTARGFADTWAVGATREVLVGAWAGTFDGAPTQGLVGMDAAAPLVRDAMLAVAADGTKMTLPDRPADIVDTTVCTDSGLAAVPQCPQIHDYAVKGHEPALDTWHDADGTLHFPARANGWLHRRVETARR